MLSFGLLEEKRGSLFYRTVLDLSVRVTDFACLNIKSSVAIVSATSMRSALLISRPDPVLKRS